MMEMDLEMDGIKISVSVPKHLSQEARKFLDTMWIAVEEIKNLNKQLEPSGKKSKESTHEPKNKEVFCILFYFQYLITIPEMLPSSNRMLIGISLHLYLVSTSGFYMLLHMPLNLCLFLHSVLGDV